MVAQPFRCDATRLKSFLDDELPEPEQSQLVGHLDTCATCRRALDRLAAGSRLWSELRRLVPAPGAGSRAAAHDSETGETAPHGAAPADGELLLEWLAPAGAAGSLGRLGPYEVTEVLGRGGFGVVLKAFDPALGRAVAIKVLAPQLATSAAARKRFAREARAAAAVVHDHVVAIHAVDSWNGLPYLVMPFIAGCSLQERVDRDGPLEVKEILRIGMQAALGLAAAHEQGLVHRDVKPSNILLENGVERVKLTDFGLARAVDDASLTQSGVVAGTPQYMSPEQARGEAVDHRSDLFSLGSVLHFVCAGHPPFRADSTPAVLRRVCDERPRPLREVNPDVPAWLEATVARLHAQDPAGRFQSAAEVAESLGRRLADLQRGARPATPRPLPSTSTRWRPGRRTAAAVVVLVAAVVLVGIASTFSERGFNVLAIASGRAQGDGGTAGAARGGQPAQPIVGDRFEEAPIIGSGKPLVKTWDLADFTRVKIGSTFRAEIIQGSGFKVVTMTDDNVLDHLRVVKDGSALTIGLEPHRTYRLKQPLKAEITLPVLEGLDLTGASRTSIKGFRSEKEFQLHLSGASQLDGSIEAGTAALQLSGASQLKLKGSARSATISAQGASRLKLSDFPLSECTIELSGASSAELEVRSGAPFKAKLAGASHLGGSVKAADLLLEIHGTSSATLRGSAEDAKIVVDGNSSAAMSELSLDGQKAIVVASGMGSVQLRGKSVAAVLEAAGMSHLDLSRLTVQAAAVDLSGQSHATVDARVKLKYELSSHSHLEYLGDPSTLEGRKSGGATISHRR
jgi:serine/threonine-protein kinase